MRRKFISILLAICMVVTLMPAMAYAAAGDPSVVYVGGTNVIEGGYWVNDGEGGITKEGADADNYNVRYDPSVKWLYLNDANITKTYFNESYVGLKAYDEYSTVYSDGSLHITLIGDNLLDPSAGDTVTYDRSCSAVAVGDLSSNDGCSLSIYGSGTGIFKGGAAKGDGLSSYNSYGLRSTYRIYLDLDSGGSVEASGGNDSSYSFGIYIPDGGNNRAAVINLRNGDVTATGGYGTARSHGIGGKLYIDSNYGGRLIASCVESQYRSALWDAPTNTPGGAYSMMGSTKTDGSDAVTYESAKNGTYLYVKLFQAKQGAAVERGPAYGTVTPYSITLMNVAVSGANPGDQVVEYALGAANSLTPPQAGWQTDRTFIGLASNMEYYGWARTRAKDDYSAGTAKIATTTILTGTDHGSDYGVYVNGIAVTAANKDDILGNKDFLGIGTAAYDENSETLRFKRNINTEPVNITNAYTDGNGKAIGIFASGDLNIVLDNEVTVNIDLTNIDKDSWLVQNLAGKGATLTGNCIGIACGGDLTISSAGAVDDVSTLDIDVAGSQIVYGIDCQGKLKLDSELLNINSNATAATSPEASAVYGKTGIDIKCGSLNASISGVDGSSACSAIGTGIFGAIDKTVPIKIIEGNIIAQNLSTGGYSQAIKGVISYPAHNYYVTGSAGNQLSDPTTFGCKYAKFEQMSDTSLSGTVADGVVNYTVSKDSRLTTGAALLVIAQYDADGRLKAAQTKDIYFSRDLTDQESNKFADAVSSDSYKLFLLEKLYNKKSYIPLCSPAQIN